MQTETGELIVSPRGTVGLTAPGVARILERISYNDSSIPVNLQEDGPWRAGFLAGRSQITAARHIGATAQERAKVARPS